MIVVTVALHSAVDESHRALGALVIANDGSYISGPRRNYDVAYTDIHGSQRGRVESWPSEDRTPLDLVGAAIASLR